VPELSSPTLLVVEKPSHHSICARLNIERVGMAVMHGDGSGELILLT
jgi:hypothetical protein